MMLKFITFRHKINLQTLPIVKYFSKVRKMVEDLQIEYQAGICGKINQVKNKINF